VLPTPKYEATFPNPHPPSCLRGEGESCLTLQVAFGFFPLPSLWAGRGGKGNTPYPPPKLPLPQRGGNFPLRGEGGKGEDSLRRGKGGVRGGRQLVGG